MRLSLSLSFCIGTIVVFGIFFLMSLVWRYKAVKAIAAFNLFCFFLAASFLVIVSLTGSVFDLVLGLVLFFGAAYFVREGFLRLLFMRDNKLLYRNWWREELIISKMPAWGLPVFVMILFIGLSAVAIFWLRWFELFSYSESLRKDIGQFCALGILIIATVVFRNKKIKKLARLA